MHFIDVFLSLFLLSIAQLVSPSPILAPREELLAFSPTILYPRGDAVWRADSVSLYNVTWRTDDIPCELENSTGIVILGYVEANSTNEHLDRDHPLATGFPLKKGRVDFTLPGNLTTRDNYVLVLMGDSGNMSPQFTILAAH